MASLPKGPAAQTPANPGPAGNPDVRKWLQGVSTADPRPTTEYVRPGEYVFQVQNVRQFIARDDTPFFVVEVRVAQVVVSVTDVNTQKLVSNRQGHSITWMVKLNQDGAQRDIRSFLGAVCTPAELDNLTDEWLDTEVAPAYRNATTVLAGRFVYCIAEDILTVKKRTQFTKVRFSPCDGPQAAGDVA